MEDTNTPFTYTTSVPANINTGRLSFVLTPLISFPTFILTHDNIFSNVLAYLFEILFIRIPGKVYHILSINIHFSISFSTLLLISFLIFVSSMAVIRYRLLTSYSRLSVDEDPEPSNNDTEKFLLESEGHSKGQRKRFDSYLDEFLFAIKIFGYLEKPVFNELTKSMRTQKLDKLETLQMDEKLGFAIVVEGNVQIFTKVESLSAVKQDKESASGNAIHTERESNGDLQTEVLFVNGEKYQLLNEVKTGNPLSSLINILSLFTEQEEDDQQRMYFNSNQSPSIRGRFPLVIDNNGIPSLNLNDTYETPTKSPFFTHLDSVDNFQNTDPTPSVSEECPQIIARATSESTIAIIPAEAFIRLRYKYPRASSHIVQMILTRLYRVTFQTAHNYLGLTKEIFETELKLNDSLRTNFEAPVDLLSRIQNTYTENSNLRTSPSDSVITLTATNCNEHGEISEENIQQLNTRRKSEASAIHPSSITKDKPTYPGFESSQSSTTPSEASHVELDQAKVSLVEAMFHFLGVTKESLITSRRSSSSNVTSLTNSPIPPGFGLYATFPTNLGDVSPGHSNSSRGLKTWSMTSSNPGLKHSKSPKESNVLDYDNAKKDFAKVVEFVHVSPDTVLVEQNSHNNGLYYVVDGELDVIYTDPETKKQQLIHKVEKGGIAGYLSSVIGYKSFVSVKARGACVLGFVSHLHMEKLCEKYFMIYLTIAKSLINSLNRTILQLDSALEWIQLDSGDTLFKQDSAANGIHIVLSGRLRSIRQLDNSDEVKIRNEYCQGQSFGEVEVLTASKRSSTIVALRDSETARIPRSLFEILALSNPSIMIKVSRIVANTVKERAQNQLANGGISNTGNNTDFKTITILPTTSGLPVNEFASHLIQAFEKVNRSVIGLNQQSMLTHLGKYAFDKLSTLRQSGFFSDLEERFKIVVYIADTNVNSSWTSSCIQQGDCILLLADANSNPVVGEYEKLLLKTRKTSARTELILLHPEKYVEPGSTIKWLKNRIWVDSHHHILFDVRNSKDSTDDKLNDPTLNIFSSSKIYFKDRYHKLYTNLQNNPFSMNLMTHVETLGQKLQQFRPRSSINHNSTQQLRPYKNDFLRLARILSNQAVGVVLGGGGARGLSHLGVLRAMEEKGIPVDIIGGTSIGSFIGGLYAKDYDIVPLYGRAKMFALRIGNLWRMVFDLTIPTAAYTTGHEFNRGLFKSFGETRIEDFWLRYFCNSTNITNSCMEVHESGYAWRFIRASMSLAGLLPPIIDKTGSMLLDGGYINNLPVEEIKNCSVIFAVDVGAVDERVPQPPCDSISGIWILLSRWNPFSTVPKFPSMSEIQMRLCYVSSVSQLERAKTSPGVIYLRPPIEDYATLDFNKFEEIYSVGCIYGDEILKVLIESNKLPNIQGTEYANEDHDGWGENGESSRHGLQRRNSI
ncbi:hypothetical protein WICPIJ_003652 [Wickerhamomyces pijperi]|uniref:Lysophospholipase NTE1 n=1 Tax=Wickerhamomyces pijperi TaxID=599730 RepID=A0A9P8Q6Q8_WICPI|nr:hypothetical protein WICPIJ_003652 [Wickerhamomyces pijperi]